MARAAPSARLRRSAASSEKTVLPQVIAIDGPSAAGKSTVGREVARRLGYPFLDTGAMYRAITWVALHRAVDLSDEDALGELSRSTDIAVGPPADGSIEPCTVWVDSEDVTERLRLPEVEAAVSLVSRVPEVRTALVETQRELAGRQAVVMAGRDIGTVVLPQADLKVYLEASVGERAGRRYRELRELGQDVSVEGVLRDLARRDSIDSQRATSPLRAAEDAVIIDTNDMTLDDVVERVMRLVEGQDA
ncbi:MAG: (d)CMP kinase [Chloroflexi bacterium]|nr:(d)CMP kinase [Chloroflexota bacterium]